MPYLKKEDYTLRISILHLDEILEQAAESSGLSPAQVLSNAENWARAVVGSYLSTQYNVKGEYLLESAVTTRNFLIMQVTIDLVLCTLHKTVNPRDIPEHIAAACTAADEWLKGVRDELISLNLPVMEVEEGTQAEIDYNRTFIHSQIKFISKPWTDLSMFDPRPTPALTEDNDPNL
jgi:hypothetical protein